LLALGETLRIGREAARGDEYPLARSLVVKRASEGTKLVGGDGASR
jgi:hypothetical protein